MQDPRIELELKMEVRCRCGQALEGVVEPPDYSNYLAFIIVEPCPRCASEIDRKGGGVDEFNDVLMRHGIKVK